MQLHTDYNVLTELDFIFAKAAFAQTYNGVAPTFNTDGRINIKKAVIHCSTQKSSADRRAPRRRFYPAYHYRSKHRW